MIHFQNLVLPSNFKSREFGQLTKKKRIDLVNEAISWKGDSSKGSYITEWLWTSPDANNRVGLGKFGKEFYLDTIRWKNGYIGNNPNDMKPTVEINGSVMEFDGSFEHVFRFFQDTYKKDTDALTVLGSLMYRAAFLIDHQPIRPNVYRYNPPKDVVD